MIERTHAMPKEGEVPAFDAGWNAHEVGLERKTVEVIAADKSWALLGYDCRAMLAPAR